MADQNIKLVVSAENRSGQTFAQIQKDLQRVRDALSAPIDGPDGDSVRKALEGRAKGLERSANAARVREEVNRRIGSGGGPDSLDDRFNRVTERSSLERSQRERRASELRDQRASEAIGREYGGAGSPASQRLTRTAGSGGDEKQSLLQSLKQVGFFAAANAAARALAAIPQIIDEYKTAVKNGENAWAAAAQSLGNNLPVIGNFINAGRGIRSGLEYLRDTDGSGNATGARKRAEDSEAAQDARDARTAIQDRNNARRAPISAAAAAALVNARESLSTSGLKGDALAVAQAQNELARKRSEANNLRQQASAFSNTDDQDKIRAAADRSDVAAREEYNQKVKSIQDAAYDAERQRMREHREQMAQDESAARQSQLEGEGKFFESKLEGIAEQNRREKATAQKAREDELKSLAENGAGSNDPRWAATQQRFADGVKGADAKAAQARQRATQDETRDREKGERDAQQRITDLEVAAAAQRLQLAGRSDEAEKLQRDAAYSKQRQDINSFYEEQIRLHAENRARLEQDRAEELKAAGDAHDANEEAAGQRLAARGRVTGPTPFGGESRLLQGVGSIADPLLAPAQQSATSAKASETHLKEIKDLQRRSTEAVEKLANAGGSGAPAKF